MTSIMGYMDLLMDDSLSAANRKTFLTTVRCNAEHLLQLITTSWTSRRSSRARWR